MAERAIARALLAQIQNTLAELYPDAPSATRIGVTAGLLQKDMIRGGSPRDNWFNLVEQARMCNAVHTLVQVVRAEYEGDKNLRDLENRLAGVDLAVLHHPLPVAVVRRHWIVATIVAASLGGAAAIAIVVKRFPEPERRPTTLYGYLQSDVDSAPLQDVSIHVENAAHVDITKHGNWHSDTDGFYLVEAVQPIDRDATIVVRIPGCPAANRLPIHDIFETRVDPKGNVVADNLKPVFKHRIACPSKAR